MTLGLLFLMGYHLWGDTAHEWVAPKCLPFSPSTTFSTGTSGQGYLNLHCLVLTAIEEDTCRLADSLAGITEVGAEHFERIYTQMGRCALAIIPAEEV